MVWFNMSFLVPLTLKASILFSLGSPILHRYSAFAVKASLTSESPRFSTASFIFSSKSDKYLEVFSFMSLSFASSTGHAISEQIAV